MNSPSDFFVLLRLFASISFFIHNFYVFLLRRLIIDVLVVAVCFTANVPRTFTLTFVEEGK